MKRRILIILVLMGLLLTIGGSAPALAWFPRRITGDIGFTAPPEWGIDLLLWIHFSVYEINPVTHRGWGQCSWMIWNEELGWRYLDSRLSCVMFGEHEGKPAAAFVSQIVRRMGWGEGEPGEYAYFWVRDGGTPGSEGDQFGINYYSLDPFIEFWPEDEPPPCEYLTPDERIDVEGGDLAIHRFRR